MPNILILLFLFILLPSELIFANEPALLSRQDAQAKLEKFLKKSASGLEQNMKFQSPRWGLQIVCPIGILCDENFTYRAYKASGQRGDVGAYFYISFSPSIVNKFKSITLDEVKDHVNYTNLEIYLNQLVSLPGWQIRHRPLTQNKEDLGKKLMINNFEESGKIFSSGARIQGKIMDTILHVYAISTSEPRCENADHTPGDCQIHFRNITIPVTFTFDMYLPDGTLDCRTNAPNARLACQ